jgi:hypothetical protein
MDLTEIECKNVNRVHLAQDRNQWCEDGNELSDSIKGGKFLE